MDIEEKIKSGYYEARRPEAPRKPRTHIDVSTMTLDEVVRHKKEVDDWNNGQIEHKKRMTEYQAERARLSKEFQEDCIEEIGLTGHPKAAMLFDIAYERGYSYGYSEILCEAKNLAPLLK